MIGVVEADRQATRLRGIETTTMIVAPPRLLPQQPPPPSDESAEALLVLVTWRGRPLLGCNVAFIVVVEDYQHRFCGRRRRTLQKQQIASALVLTSRGILGRC
ncbi:unnamed protein product [Dibothriocephalus latus]|uniref:Uncharacterized protein n=1 Tax=Dibothriocephalus latus TaxID=60516 RepID=A0A3P7LNW3_DIBLA|nr:unnamed protein product [Dibothriocephalus latus]